MTVPQLARAAAVTAATSALLLGSLTVAGAASAGEKSPSEGSDTRVSSNTAVLKAPHLTVPHGRKIG